MNSTTLPECQPLDLKCGATELCFGEEAVRCLVRCKVLRKLSGLRRVLISKPEVQKHLDQK